MQRAKYLLFRLPGSRRALQSVPGQADLSSLRRCLFIIFFIGSSAAPEFPRRKHLYTEFKDQTTPAWDGFHGTQWRYEINVREFIQDNYLPYDGDESFLAGPTGPM